MTTLESAGGEWWTCSICGDIHESELNDNDRAAITAGVTQRTDSGAAS